MRELTKYNKVVIVTEYNEITILRESFNNGNFKGLVGASFYPISKKEYKERTSLKSITENLKDNFSNDDLDYNYKYTESGRLSKNPYKRWAKDIIDNDEAESWVFDNSFSELWDYMREELNLSEKEAYIFECVSCGRVFNKNDKFTHNKDLEYLLLEFEG